jgi:protein involved in polysaccharide export with SLBB domain
MAALVTAIVTFVSLFALAGEAGAGSWVYRLRPGDSLQIAVFGRPDLSGSFRLRESGDLSFPLVGTVPGHGDTVPEFESRLAAALAGALDDEIQVSVQLLEYQPIYIDGDVARPGAYSYRPGLTVDTAVALAGGRHSLRSSGMSSLIGQTQERERIDVMLDTYWADVAREARLIAERDGHKEVTFPNDLMDRRDDPRVAEILINEQEIFASRLQAFEEAVASIEDQRSRFDEEVAELEAQRAAMDRRHKLIERQIQDIKSLADEGVVPKAQVLELEIAVTRIEQEARAAAISMIRARQHIDRLRESLVGLRTQRRSEMAVSLQAVRDRLVRSRIQIDLAAKRLALMKTAEPTREVLAETETPSVYTVLRPGAEGPQTMDADGRSEVRPGDVIRVPFPELTLPDVLGAPLPDRLKVLQP